MNIINGIINNRILLEADYSTADSIINGIQTGQIGIKKNVLNQEYFKQSLNIFVKRCTEKNINIGKVLNLFVKKMQPFDRIHILTNTELDALEYYLKYKSSPAFKDLILKLETTNMSLVEFHNKAQDIAETTRNNQRKQRKEETRDEDIKVLYNDGKWKVVRPMTWQASVRAATFPFGKAKWCTASSEAKYYFDEYTSDGKAPLYIVSDGTKENTFQVAMNKKGACDIQYFDNQGVEVDLSKVPDEVLKVCKNEDKNLYEVKHYSENHPNKVKIKKLKDGWTEIITYNKDYEKIEDLRDYMYDVKKDKEDIIIKKEYVKGDKKILHKRKNFYDKLDKDDNFEGILQPNDDMPNKIKKEKYVQERKLNKREEADKNYDYKRIPMDSEEYNELKKLNIENCKGDFGQTLKDYLDDHKDIKHVKLTLQTLPLLNSEELRVQLFVSPLKNRSKYDFMATSSDFVATYLYDIRPQKNEKLYRYILSTYFSDFVNKYKKQNSLKKVFTEPFLKEEKYFDY